MNGYPIETYLKLVEEELADRGRAIASGTLEENFDWEYDLSTAQFDHRHNLSWIELNKEIRQKQISYWSDIALENSKYLKDLSLMGFRTIVIIHGAVALGSINLLTQKSGEQSASVILAAKFGLFFAIVGIVTAAIGQLITFHALAGIFGKIHAKLASIPRWKTIRAFSRFSQKFVPALNVATKLIYGSIFWFCAYSIILYLIIIFH